MITEQARIGAMGEKAAVKWLRNDGYLIRDLNWRTGHYELDIVAEKYGVTYFVEVKTRRKEGRHSPEQAFTKEKYRAIRNAINAYKAQYYITGECQTCLVAVDVHESGELDIRMIDLTATILSYNSYYY